MSVIDIQFESLGVTKDHLDYLLKLGLKYDKRQKRQLLAATKLTLPSEDEVRDFEKAIKSALPSKYRNFLLKYNGGVPSKSRIYVSTVGEKVVQRCYAMKSPATQYTLDYVNSLYKGRVPSGFLPIADDPAGSLFLIAYSDGEEYGDIYFWDHEEEGEGQPYIDNIYWVASSFDEFLHKLD